MCEFLFVCYDYEAIRKEGRLPREQNRFFTSRPFMRKSQNGNDSVTSPE